MIPQSHFTVIAPLAAGRVSALRALLDTMNTEPGVADPDNALLPFGKFGRLHFARLVVLEDPTLIDFAVIGMSPPNLPAYLAFFGDCDGSAYVLLEELSQRAGAGLREIFSHCENFDERGDLLAWMLAHNRPPAANYINWVGRTVLQIKQESALRRALSAKVTREPLASGAAAQQRRHELIAFVEGEVRAGRLSLTPPETTPPGWQIAKLLNLIAVPVAGSIAMPLLIVLLPLLIIQLRNRETSDPEICPRPDPEALLALQLLEDRDVTNQYSALGSVKPGLFRRWLLTALLVLVEYGCRHIFTRGYLARVQTIHFARWAFIDDKRRVVFISNYDGGHEAYMDDFINKVAWGLNLVFSNGIGWPRTDWLILGGARREHLFKYYQRRHQIPTQVWYKAYPGLSLMDIARNQRIREGLERTNMNDEQALAWLKLL